MSVNNEETRSTNFTKFLENIVQKKTILDNSPVQVMIGLTNVCNLHCAFCPYCGFCMKKIKSSEMIPLNGIIKLKEFIRRGGYNYPFRERRAISL